MATTVEDTAKPDDVKVDHETAWIRFRTLGPVIAVTATAVVLYMRFDTRMGRVEEIMHRDATVRAAERDAIVRSVDGVRDELRKVFIDSVAARQAQQWIELTRALNKAKLPELVFPDLPR